MTQAQAASGVARDEAAGRSQGGHFPEHTAGSIAALVAGELEGSPGVVIAGLSGLDDATEQSLTFIRSKKFANGWASSKAGAALVTRGIEVPGHDPARRALIRVPDADLAMVKVLAAFSPAWHAPDPGIHPAAVVDATAQVAKTARIGPGCVVGPHARIGDHTTLHANVTIGAHVTIGPGCVLFPGVVIYDRCSMGAQSILHGNVTIGADGFGYRPDPQGRGLIKIPHIGTVQIGNGVEIGAGTCVDRGKFGPTIIGDGTKIDNLCQIGHNVKIGRCCIICGMTALAGSVILEDGVTLAGHVGVADGLTVGTRAIISAKAGVTTSVPPGETWFGSPAGPHKDQMRAYAALRKLSDHMRALKRYEKEMARKAGKDLPDIDNAAQG